VNAINIQIPVSIKALVIFIYIKNVLALGLNTIKKHQKER